MVSVLGLVSVWLRPEDRGKLQQGDNGQRGADDRDRCTQTVEPLARTHAGRFSPAVLRAIDRCGLRDEYAKHRIAALKA